MENKDIEQKSIGFEVEKYLKLSTNEDMSQKKLKSCPNHS